MTHAKTIADGYLSYVDDELGYSYEAWDVLSVEAIRAHDVILHTDSASLDAVDRLTIDDFERWALARAYRRCGELEGFFGVCESLTLSTAAHPGIVYTEVVELYAEELARANRLAKAQSKLAEARLRWPEPGALPYAIDARILLLAGDLDLALGRYRALADAHPDDAELRFEIAEDLTQNSQTSSAGPWLDEALAVAERVGDRALIVDIELLRIELGALTEERKAP
ncbi:MAG: hypothetical protein H0U74_07580 [Bradymonadaceae bacterium]|nr:hypothetical protein [Lujinxingiaceae bacterium]